MALLMFCFADKYPDEFSEMFPALDIWHKSVKLTKKKLAKVRGGMIYETICTSDQSDLCKAIHLYPITWMSTSVFNWGRLYQRRLA